MSLPSVMGVINVTPDSFSDGGRFLAEGAATALSERLVAEGADWLDVGGESTRPGAVAVPVDEELRRVVPVVRWIAQHLPGVTLSVDTRHAAVAAAALDAGASVVNDVSGGEDPAMFGVVASRSAGLVLMHMRGTPADMAQRTAYDDVVGEVCAWLGGRLDAARAAGVARLWVDPGLGFAKAPADNPRLIAALPRLKALGAPVVIGASRKRFIGELTGVADPAERVAGSVGAALAAASLGADVLRVHDVAATIQALKVFVACRHG